MVLGLKLAALSPNCLPSLVLFDFVGILYSASVFYKSPFMPRFAFHQMHSSNPYNSEITYTMPTSSKRGTMDTQSFNSYRLQPNYNSREV